mmetsp:Transcript_37703/g.80561  ORF Transcript_37703/g.80561 Transcript_37703/m.80561 type:complete len:285 (-) Transcript_37703:425-1279(-)
MDHHQHGFAQAPVDVQVAFQERHPVTRSQPRRVLELRHVDRRHLPPQTPHALDEGLATAGGAFPPRIGDQRVPPANGVQQAPELLRQRSHGRRLVEHVGRQEDRVPIVAPRERVEVQVPVANVLDRRATFVVAAIIFVVARGGGQRPIVDGGACRDRRNVATVVRVRATGSGLSYRARRESVDCRARHDAVERVRLPVEERDRPPPPSPPAPAGRRGRSAIFRGGRNNGRRVHQPRRAEAAPDLHDVRRRPQRARGSSCERRLVLRGGASLLVVQRAEDESRKR